MFHYIYNDITVQQNEVSDIERWTRKQVPKRSLTLTVYCCVIVMVCALLQALGETGQVVSEDSDSDVRVEVSGHVWTFSAACCTRLAAPAKPTDKQRQSEHVDKDSSDDADSDDDDDDDDDDSADRRQTIRTLVCSVLLMLCSFLISHK